MDAKPFFSFNILHFEDHQINELKKFTKSAFSLEDILTTASTLKYTGAIKKILDEELKNPSEAFVRFFTAKIYDKRLTQQVIEQFTHIVKEARIQYINEQINERLKSALSANEVAQETEQPQENGAVVESQPENDGIVTTQDEIDGYNIVKAILYETVDVDRVIMRDTKSYCGILLDNNNRKPICRLRFNYSQKYLGIISGKNEERIEIDGVNDIFKYAERIKSTIKEYES